MPQLKLNNQFYSVGAEETVLDALLRQDVEVPHGCKAGACHSCLMRAEEGAVPPAAQAGLKPSQKEQGYFLSCSCKPTTDLNLTFAAEELPKVPAKVLDVAHLNAQVLRIQLQKVFDFQAGQYLNIWLDETTVRSYSIASAQSLDDFIELHVKLLPGGRFSQDAAQNLRAGDTLTVQGPLGECVYTATDAQQPLLLVGIGTGLAPLYGIIKEAIAQRHSGPLHLVLGARSGAGFYLQEQLEQIGRDAQLTVDYVCLEGATEQYNEGDLYQFIAQRYSSTKGCRIFLCGAETFVRKMKKQCFLAGANMRDIHADAFLPCS